MGSFKWLLDFHLRHPIKFTYVLIAPIVEVLLYLYPVSITADIIQQVLDNNLTNLIDTLIFLFFFAIFQAAVFFSLNFVNEILAHRVTTDITKELFESVQSKSMSFHDGKNVGQIMARATGDTRTINKALSPGIVRLLALFTFWILALIIAFILDMSLLIISLVMFSVYLFSLYKFAVERIEISRKVLVDFSGLSEISLRSVSGIKEIKGFTAEKDSSSMFDGYNSSHNRSLVREGEKAAWFYPALVSTIYAAGMITTSIYLAFIGSINFADVVLISGIILALQRVSSRQQWQSRQIIAAIAAVRRVYNLIHEEDIQEITHGETALDDLPASIEFRDVSFRYREDLPIVLEDISFKVEDSQTIAIVGRPGSGKSTLTKLIQRLYLPTTGRILLGGKPIEEIERESLRQFIATVEQDIFLFNKTIMENIRFGRPDATDYEVKEVAKLAQAHSFITQFPDGYNTIIGERGVRLSGGQAQRISIARALLMKPSILLMDDGVSALDAKTEIEIQRAISDILETRTTVITTHRLSIIAKSDLVIILDNNTLVGKGTHEELIRSNPHYRRLFEFHYELPPIEVRSD